MLRTFTEIFVWTNKMVLGTSREESCGVGSRRVLKIRCFWLPKLSSLSSVYCGVMPSLSDPRLTWLSVLTVSLTFSSAREFIFLLIDVSKDFPLSFIKSCLMTAQTNKEQDCHCTVVWREAAMHVSLSLHVSRSSHYISSLRCPHSVHPRPDLRIGIICSMPNMTTLLYPLMSCF